MEKGFSIIIPLKGTYNGKSLLILEDVESIYTNIWYTLSFFLYMKSHIRWSAVRRNVQICFFNKSLFSSV